MDATGIMGIVIGCAVSAIIGAVIGSKRNLAGSGFFWSLFLGPIGWLIVLCKEVPDDDGIKITGPLPSKVRLPQMIYIIKEGCQDGPYTVKEVLEKYERKEIDPTSLCACPGDEAWVPLEERVSRAVWTGLGITPSASSKRYAY